MYYTANACITPSYMLTTCTKASQHYVNCDDEMLTVQKSYGLQVVCMQLMLLMTHNPQNAHIMLHTHKCVIHAFIH